ncbi:MAG: 2-amino-4-hydroxy-6-hydroxymethyldihydropteridine diphosphokinase [Candidatus Paracaedibacteraceae bacterium]|nr:2-amino-4-hydroxy-6-hydroxymethyldihydropteridine diphosphokinase [Candidatus Paracaedibacteraceae bacterium]
MRVFIGLGSNLGDSEQNLKKAIQRIHHAYPIIAQSSIFLTKAQYIEDQPDFYNQVVEIYSEDDPQTLLAFLRDLESLMGRQRTIKYGPRLIDLDIIFFGDLIVASETLQIPHPLFAERDFVLRPLLQIAPDWLCPKSGQSIAALNKNLESLCLS